jgi:hypothetical protein
MTRICAIGNSHLAALKLGWDSIAHEFNGVKLIFVGAGGDLVGDLKVEDGCLVPSTASLRQFMEDLSGGLSKIDPGSFDGFLVCGLEFSVLKVMYVADKFRAEAHAKDERHPVSDECFYLASVGCLRTSLMVQTLTKLRRITEKPIAVLPAPMCSDEDQRPIWQRAEANGDDAKLAEIFASAAQHLATELNFRLFPQPSHTLASSLRTKRIYRQGSIRLSRGSNKIESAQGDYRHMNGEYGAAALREALGGWDLCSRLPRAS